MSNKQRKLGIDSWLLIVGSSLLVISSVLSLAYLPLFLNKRISEIEWVSDSAREEIDRLNSAYQQKESLDLESLILRLDLDKLLLDYPEDSPLIVERKTELIQTELSALNVMGQSVLDDNEYQQKALQWETMTYDQIQIEQDIIQQKFGDSKQFYNTQITENEPVIIATLNSKDNILYVTPLLFIFGTILSQISAFRRHIRKD